MIYLEKNIWFGEFINQYGYTYISVNSNYQFKGKLVAFSSVYMPEQIMDSLLEFSHIMKGAIDSADGPQIFVADGKAGLYLAPIKLPKLDPYGRINILVSLKKFKMLQLSKKIEYKELRHVTIY